MGIDDIFIQSWAKLIVFCNLTPTLVYSKITKYHKFPPKKCGTSKELKGLRLA